jgi:hypothetical protein
MPPMTSIRPLAALLVLVALAGCATAPSSPPPRGSQAPRVRCLSDPNETGGMRPLIFLFCVESP